METTQFTFEFADEAKRRIKVSFLHGTNAQKAIQQLSEFFAYHLQGGVQNWTIDLSNMPFPTTSAIAFFVSATEQLRKRAGDLKLINASDSARNNFMTFSPLAYLSIDDGQAPAASQPQNRFTELNETGVSTLSVPPPATQKRSESGGSQRALKANLNIVEPEIAKTIPTQTSGRSEAPVANPVQNSTRNNQHPKTESPTEKKFYLRTESEPANLYKICDFVVEHAKRAGMRETHINKARIAVYEACLNVIEHAYHSNPDNWIEVWVEYPDDSFKIIIQDYGLSLTNRQTGEYDVEVAMERRQTGGFGMHIIERSMDKVEYVADPINGNQLTLVKSLKS